jgi:hypothetical protein
MPNRDTLLRSIVAVTMLIVTGCQSNEAASMSPAARLQRSTSIIGNAQQCFTLTLSPTSATITAGQSVKVAVQLASKGLVGTVNVAINNISPQPQGGDGFTIYQPRYDIWLDKGSTAVAYITLGATPSTLKTTWTITIQGKVITGGPCDGETQSATFLLTVQ